jgi:hypothetical protein
MEDITQSSQAAQPSQETVGTATTQPSTQVDNQSEPYVLCQQVDLSFYYYHPEHAPDDAERELRVVPLSKLGPRTVCCGCWEIITATATPLEKHKPRRWGERPPSSVKKKTGLS